eukprot:2713440-Prymnesium_polylepis.2
MFSPPLSSTRSPLVVSPLQRSGGPFHRSARMVNQQRGARRAVMKPKRTKIRRRHLHHRKPPSSTTSTKTSETEYRAASNRKGGEGEEAPPEHRKGGGQ